MTQHSSLRGSGAGGKFRSVLKRYEKIKELAEKEKWDEEKDSVFALPKIKRIKFKVKKVKGPAEEEGEAAEGAEGAVKAPEEAAAGGTPQKGTAKKETAAKKEPPAKEGKGKKA